MKKVIFFKTRKLEEKWLERFENLKYRFHDLYEDANECLQEAYILYKEVIEHGYNKDYLFKIIHCITNIRTEIIIESEGRVEDLELVYFIKNNMKCANTEYQKKQLRWMEAKALSLSGNEFLNSTIHIYNQLIAYFKKLTSEIETEEDYKKQLLNLGALYIEVSEIYSRNKNKISSTKYAELYLILYIDLYNSDRITKEEFDRGYDRYKKINGELIGIENMLINSTDKSKIIL